MRQAEAGYRTANQVAREQGDSVNQLRKWKQQLEREALIGAPTQAAGVRSMTKWCGCSVRTRGLREVKAARVIYLNIKRALPGLRRSEDFALHLPDPPNVLDRACGPSDPPIKTDLPPRLKNHDCHRIRQIDAAAQR
ncbi:MAG: hypothetical protein H7X91_06430 [Burkholderiales bacterium]|nr:hypothetical protein [Burkholderiales bacterium]